ncbi:type IV pilus modification protein PilV [Cellvibrio sp. OA-2007]|uniref:type IV pilus modification protein PilV n=1 Tax=Cellvibrio sp. OA-2007 TaxID=529823 RepID=UPI000781FC31|nr:type IV pilus modification protein PilV [Cellvibrio sp. OA-2007]
MSRPFFYQCKCEQPDFQRGVGLIEVLVTLLILSTSLLALGAMQTRSLQFNQGAYFRSQANIFAYDLLDRMRINVKNIKSYTSELTHVKETETPVLTPLAAADLHAWRRNISAELPNGKGGVDCDDATKICTLTIEWDELNSSGEDAENKTTFTYSARL